MLQCRKQCCSQVTTLITAEKYAVVMIVKRYSAKHFLKTSNQILYKDRIAKLIIPSAKYGISKCMIAKER